MAYPELVWRGVSERRKCTWPVRVGASNGVTPDLKKSWSGGGVSGQPENPPGYGTGLEDTAQFDSSVLEDNKQFDSSVLEDNTQFDSSVLEDTYAVRQLCIRRHYAVRQLNYQLQMFT